MAKTNRLFEVSFTDNTRLREIADEHPAAVARALNRTAKSARTMASKLIRERYNIKKADLDPSIKVFQARKGNLIASVEARGARFPIMDFMARQTKRGVTFSIVRGARKTLPGSFVAAMKSGHEGVFTREGPKRLPIKERYTISIAEMFGSMNISDEVEKFISTELPAQAETQVNAILKGYVGE